MQTREVSIVNVGKNEDEEHAMQGEAKRKEQRLSVVWYPESQTARAR